jgi:hypothetical protein
MDPTLIGIFWFGGGAIFLTCYTISNHPLRKLGKDICWLAGGILGGSGMVSFIMAWVFLAAAGPYYHSIAADVGGCTVCVGPCVVSLRNVLCRPLETTQKLLTYLE